MSPEGGSGRGKGAHEPLAKEGRLCLGNCAGAAESYSYATADWAGLPT